MKQFEHNVINSFSLAKADITTLYANVKFILKQLEEIKFENQELKEMLYKKTTVKVRKASNKRIAEKIIKKTVKKKFIGSNSSNKVHNGKCPFAQNIKPKNKVSFASKVKALNEGYKLCKCLN